MSFSKWQNITTSLNVTPTQAIKDISATSLYEEIRAISTPDVQSTVLLVPESNTDGGVKYSTATTILPGLYSPVDGVPALTFILESATSTTTSTAFNTESPPQITPSIIDVCHASPAASPNIAIPTTMALQPRGSNKVFSNSWIYQGCYTEATNARALPSSTYANDTMTLESCAAFCEGSYMMGLEYARECYCSDVLSAGSVPTSNQADCSMLCKGNTSESCGSANLLQLYFFATTASGTPVTLGTPQISGSIVATSAVDPCATSPIVSTSIQSNTIIVPAASTISSSSPPTSFPLAVTKPDSGLSNSVKAGIGVGIALTVIILALAGLFFLRRQSTLRLSHIWPRTGSDTDSTSPLNRLTIAPDYDKSISYPRRLKLRGDSDNSREAIVDENGVVWPEKVELKGEAKELREHTETYTTDYRRKMALRLGRSEESVTEQRGNNLIGGHRGYAETGMPTVEEGEEERPSEAKLARRARQRDVERRRREKMVGGYV